jgi:hypothetical protein
MRSRPLSILIAVLALAAAAGSATAQGQKVKLTYKATSGSVARYRSEATLQMDVMGQKLTLETAEVEKVTFTVKPSGEISAERESESQEATLNGQKLPPETNKEKTTVTFRPDGTLVSVTTTDSDKEALQLTVRLYPTTSPIFVDREVGVGDKWTHDFTASAETGAKAGRAEYEVLGLEKVGGQDAARIRITYRETEGSPALTSTGTAAVELASGDTLSGEFSVEHVPFPGPGGMTLSATAKVKQERTAGSPLGGKVEAAKEKTIDDIVKDFEKLPGLLTLYRKKEAGRETVYAELKESQLEQLFFVQATASTGTGGNIIAGDPLGDLLVKFVLAGDDRVLLVTPNVNFRAQADQPVARSVRRAFADGYLEAFKIEARQPERKSLLLNISTLFTSDLFQIGRALGGGGGPGGAGAYALDRDKSYVATWKVFPENLFIQTAYHFARPGGPAGSALLADGRSVPLRVNFNLFAVEQTDYVPRLADPRVGYFYTEVQDFTNDGADTQMVRYILRWDVRKADPNALVSPPAKPIVFWLDNAIPTEYREAVRDGILMWNSAFLKAGIRDAIQVKQMPDDADWDHADMRYNVIRWSTTPDPPYGAIALFRVNPLTGQIVNAGITVDAVLTRSAKFERRRLVEPAAAFDPQPPPRPDRFGRTRCEHALGAIDQAWFGYTALDMLAAAGQKPDEKQYTNDFLRSIVAHEMGHILGLFHNFAASTQFSLEELKNPEKVRTQGIVGSVMDYVPFNIAALKTSGVDYWTPTLGRYDVWAVQYGYTPFGARRPEDEEGRLRSIASRGNEPGLAYRNDLMADQWDPMVGRFDLSSDPLAYYQRQMQVARYLLTTLEKREPQPGKSYWEFTRAFNGLMNVYSSSAASASRYIGGLYARGNFRGDPGEKPVLQPVEGTRQRQALQLLTDYIFSETALIFPKSYYERLTDNPFPSFSGFSGANDYPMLNMLSNLQRAALRRVMSPSVLSRVVNNEFKAARPGDSLTLAGLFNGITGAVWSELPARRNVSALRRQLQRAHLELLTGMVTSPTPTGPEDARMLAWHHLRTLKARIQAAQAGNKLDEYTSVHLAESLMRVNRALNATQTIGGGGGGGPSIIQLLVGADPARPEEAAPAPR